MSESVEIKKEFDVQIDFVECYECGKNLDFTAASDSHGDIQITVAKCDCD